MADTSNSAVKEIPYGGGTYGAPVTLGSGFSFPGGVAVDANGNVFVADTDHNAAKEIPYSGGAYGAAVTVGSGYSFPDAVAVDTNGRLYVADEGEHFHAGAVTNGQARAAVASNPGHGTSGRRAVLKQRRRKEPGAPRETAWPANQAKILAKPREIP